MRYNADLWETVPVPEKLKNSAVYAVASTPQELFLATYMKIWSYDGTRWSRFEAPRISDMVATEQGIWLALQRKGLGFFDYEQRNLITWTTRDGLYNNFVKQVSPDDRGRVWLKHANGEVSVYSSEGLRRNRAKIQE